MSEEGSQKNFEPTHGRLAKARADGDSARSSELSGAFAFAAGIAGVLAAVPVLAVCARGALLSATKHPFAYARIPSELPLLLTWALVPAGCAAVAGAALSLLQSGGFRPVAITLRFDRLSPVQGLKRLLSREAFIHAIRAIVAVACIVAALLPTVVALLSSGIGSREAPSLAQLAWQSAVRCAFIVAGLGVLFGGVDFALVFANWRKKLRMTFDEVKRDHKEQDGDPAAKARRRSMHRDISRSSLKRVAEAAFVVVNPTHIAVALEYRPPEIAVPRVLLKAADESALRVRDAAREFKVPIIENVPLARSLYATTKPGDVIPKETYLAVAEIVASLSKAGVL